LLQQKDSTETAQLTIIENQDITEFHTTVLIVLRIILDRSASNSQNALASLAPDKSTTCRLGKKEKLRCGKILAETQITQWRHSINPCHSINRSCSGHGCCLRHGDGSIHDIPRDIPYPNPLDG